MIFPHAEFVSAVTLGYRRTEEYDGLQLPARHRFGTFFPARSDDSGWMSAVAAKCIDAWAANPPCSPCMTVYEQDQKAAVAGVRMVTEL